MPDDPTPHGGEALHGLPDRATIPQPKPDPAKPWAQGDQPAQGHAQRPSAREIEKRPELPREPQTMPADTLARPDPVGSRDPEDADENGKPPAPQQPVV